MKEYNNICQNEKNEKNDQHSGQNFDNSKEKKINARIKKEKNRLNRILDKVDPVVKKANESLIENAAFMTVSLQDLMKSINTKGFTETYQNGKDQQGTKKCPEVELYNAMVKNHAVYMKQLTDLIPKELPKLPEQKEPDPLERIIRRDMGCQKS